MLTFRLFCEAVARPALSLDAVKTLLSHVSGDSLQHAARGGHFILPDGSVWESRTFHMDAFRGETDERAWGTREDELTFWATIKATHIVLAHTGRAYECQASISAAQADKMVYAYKLTNPPGQEPNMMYVDIQNGGMPVDNKMFTDRVTAVALRTWVNSHF
jgi:hypothetical protein